MSHHGKLWQIMTNQHWPIFLDAEDCLVVLSQKYLILYHKLLSVKLMQSQWSLLSPHPPLAFFWLKSGDASTVQVIMSSVWFIYSRVNTFIKYLNRTVLFEHANECWQILFHHPCCGLSDLLLDDQLLFPVQVKHAGWLWNHHNIYFCLYLWSQQGLVCYWWVTPKITTGPMWESSLESWAVHCTLGHNSDSRQLRSGQTILLSKIAEEINKCSST